MRWRMDFFGSVDLRDCVTWDYSLKVGSSKLTYAPDKGRAQPLSDNPWEGCGLSKLEIQLRAMSIGLIFSGVSSSR